MTETDDHEIDIIIQKQIMVAKYTAKLEDRRERLMEFIQTSPDLNLSEKVRNNLMENVINMKIEVIGGGNPNKETVTVNVF